jgi:hypothetical protein
MFGETDDDTGFSPFVWYKLGQSSARSSQVTAETTALVKRGFAPPQIVTDLDNAISEVHRVDNELRLANDVIQQWMDHSARLEAKISSRNAELAELRAKNAALQRDLDIAVSAYQDSATEHAALVKRVLDYTRRDKS